MRSLFRPVVEALLLLISSWRRVFVLLLLEVATIVGTAIVEALVVPGTLVLRLVVGLMLRMLIFIVPVVSLVVHPSRALSLKVAATSREIPSIAVVVVSPVPSTSASLIRARVAVVESSLAVVKVVVVETCTKNAL